MVMREWDDRNDGGMKFTSASRGQSRECVAGAEEVKELRGEGPGKILGTGIPKN